MPDHVHLLVSVDPNLAFIADEAGERPFVSFFAPGISCVATKSADLVDELVFGQDKTGSAALCREAVHRATKACRRSHRRSHRKLQSPEERINPAPIRLPRK